MNTELTKLCCDLINIPSLNPQNTGKTITPYGESEIADFIFQWLKQRNLSPQLQPVNPQRPNVFALAEGDDATQTLLLTAHMDTVDVQGMTIDPFAAQIKNDRIFGRGASDDKGPLAVIMQAFDQTVKASKLPFNLAFLATCGEEFDMSGAAWFAQNSPVPITAAIFAEPTDLNVIAAHKGVLRLRLKAHGKMSHSSIPETGQNAIYPIARAVTLLENHAEKLRQNPQHDLLGCETLAVTIIRGGQQINIVPDKCYADVDYRFLPNHSPEDCLRKIEQLLQNNQLGNIQLKTSLICKPMETDPSSPLTINMHNAAIKTVPNSQIKGVAYATDASQFTHLNIPAVVFGPGNRPHTEDESIEIKALEKALKIMLNYLQNNWGLNSIS